ncbi:MAG TPA: hypothetical protein VFA73_00240, partial [Actinomycetota bacterium]|nr:hypothetical protein [Actinomycetota bacterium]
MTGAFGHGGPQGSVQQPKLDGPAHHRRFQVASVPQDVRSDTEQPERLHRVALALHRERRHRFDRGRVADESPGLLADEHFAGAGRLLEPSSHVHRVADDDLLPMDRVADHHLPSVHAGPQGKAHAPRRFELAIQLGQGIAQLRGASHRPQRVVLVQLRDAVHRHHGVPDELGDGAAMTGEHLGGAVVVPGEHLPERLRVEPLT